MIQVGNCHWSRNQSGFWFQYSPHFRRSTHWEPCSQYLGCFKGQNLFLAKSLECEERRRPLRAKQPVHCKLAEAADNLFIDNRRMWCSSDPVALPWRDQKLPWATALLVCAWKWHPGKQASQAKPKRRCSVSSRSSRWWPLKVSPKFPTQLCASYCCPALCLPLKVETRCIQS